jgi:hypothetical protein
MLCANVCSEATHTKVAQQMRMSVNDEHLYVPRQAAAEAQSQESSFHSAIDVKRSPLGGARHIKHQRKGKAKQRSTDIGL